MIEDDDISAYLADLDDVVASAFECWRPPPKLTLSQWADEKFYLSAESAAEPGRWKTLPYQREPMDSITDPEIEQVVFMKSARVGYALAIETPIPTSSGWSTMKDLRLGDTVFDENGQPCRVLFKSPVFEDHDCYLIRFCDGSEIVADAGHRWLVESDVSLEHLIAERSGRTGRPKPGEQVNRVGVIDTEEMSKALTTSRGRNALAIRNTRPLQTDALDLPVPPYTFGLWLGDGHMVSPRITQHRSDVETAQFIEAEGIKVKVCYPDSRYPNNATYFLDCEGSRNDPSPWARVMRDMGVLSNKHIPTAYLRASVSQRLELLRGLMDSDGTVTADGRAEFNNTNERLASGVFELVVSLGMKATFRYRAPIRTGYLPQYRINFKAVPEMNPFHLPRKSQRVKPLDKPSITNRRRVISVDRVPSIPVQCIQVDSQSNLFLAGRQMIPTHNTKMIDAAIGYFIDQDPASMLVIQPTIDGAKIYSKEEIQPMLRDCPALAQIMFTEQEEEGPKGGANTMMHKRFPGGVLSLAGANSGAGFRSISRRVVIFDEVDAYPVSAGQDGDPIKLGIKRSEYFWNRKIIAGSTPLIAGHSRIEQLFHEGDQRRYYVPCPQCGHFDYFVFSQRESGGHFMQWPPDRPHEAFFVCSENGCIIEHKSKREMVEAGEWRATAPAVRGASGRLKVSYHIWAAYSFSPNATWGQIAIEFLDAKGDPEKLKTVINTLLGETWQEQGEAPDWQRLYQRREEYQIGTVPPGVLFLTAGVDVQKDRFVYEVVGWGECKESWSIESGVIPADTSNDSDWTKLDELLNRSYLTSTNSNMSIAILAVDSGFNTQTVYNWARRHPMSRVIAVKGVSTAKTLLGSPTETEIKRNGQRLRGYKVWPIGVDIAKAQLYGWLKLPPSTPAPNGFCHFPEYGEDYFKQLTSEHLISVTSKKGYRVHEWHLIPGRENHFLDCRVYARAAAALGGLDRMKPRVVAQTEAAPSPAPVARPIPKPAKLPDSRPSRNGIGIHGKGWLSKRR